MNEQALYLAKTRLAKYRANVRDEYVRDVIERWLATSQYPEAETDQDIVYFYESSLRWVEHSKGQG